MANELPPTLGEQWLEVRHCFRCRQVRPLEPAATTAAGWRTWVIDDTYMVIVCPPCSSNHNFHLTVANGPNPTGPTWSTMVSPPPPPCPLDDGCCAFYNPSGHDG